VLLVALALAGCGRDRAPADEGHISLEERAEFRAPADSSLTTDQVDRYLRATLAQLDLLQAERTAVRDSMERLREARRQAARGGTARPRSPGAIWSDFVDATYIRSARDLGYNPAELWFVRARLAAVGGHLMAQQAYAGKDQAAAMLRQQAEMMRGQPGVPPEQIEAMLQGAREAEDQAPPPSPPRLLHNLATLRQARAQLSDSSWARIGSVAAGTEVSALGELDEGEMARKLDELRELFRAAVENRVR
jgi:hypothetical protein